MKKNKMVEIPLSLLKRYQQLDHMYGHVDTDVCLLKHDKRIASRNFVAVHQETLQFLQDQPKPHGANLVALYVYYCKRGNEQGHYYDKPTNRPYCPYADTAKHLKWGKPKLNKYIKMLEDFGLLAWHWKNGKGYRQINVINWKGGK